MLAGDEVVEVDVADETAAAVAAEAYVYVSTRSPHWAVWYEKKVPTSVEQPDE